MKKPDPDKFARIVLSDLACIHAEVSRTRHILELIARHLQLPNIDKKLEIQEMMADKFAKEMSAEALKKAGFEE